MSHLRALALLIADRLCCWADGDGDPLSFKESRVLLRKIQAGRQAAQEKGR